MTALSAHAMAEIVYQKRLLTVADYLEMGRRGILRPDERVELIHGEMVVMTSQGPVHANGVRRLNTLLSRRIFEHGHEVAEVSVQLPLVISEHSAPEPDVALLRIADYADRHPEGGDVLLAVEVSVTSLSYDREVKVPMFAAAGIPEVWIVNYIRPLRSTAIRETAATRSTSFSRATRKSASVNFPSWASSRLRTSSAKWTTPPRWRNWMCD